MKYIRVRSELAVLLQSACDRRMSLPQAMVLRLYAIVQKIYSLYGVSVHSFVP